MTPAEIIGIPGLHPAARAALQSGRLVHPKLQAELDRLGTSLDPPPAPPPPKSADRKLTDAHQALASLDDGPVLASDVSGALVDMRQAMGG